MYWDDVREEIVDTYPNFQRLNNKLKQMMADIMDSMLDLKEDLSYETAFEIVSGKSKSQEVKDKDFITYANQLNDDNYSAQKYGYTTWYNKHRYILAFEKFFVFYLKKPRPTLNSLKPEHFQDYVKYRFDVRGNTCKEAINKTLIPLYAALDYAAKNGDADSSYVNQITSNFLTIRETKYSEKVQDEESVKYLTPNQIRSLCKSCEKIQKKSTRDVMDLFFFSFYACGLRLSDIITLEWKHINFETRKLHKVQVKTKKAPEVDIPLSEPAMQILYKWRDYNVNSRFVFNHIPEDFDLSDEKKLFSTRNSRDKGINRVLRVIGHNFKLLGHSSISATEMTYAKFLKEKVDKKVENILNFQM